MPPQKSGSPLEGARRLHHCDERLPALIRIRHQRIERKPVNRITALKVHTFRIHTHHRPMCRTGFRHAHRTRRTREGCRGDARAVARVSARPTRGRISRAGPRKLAARRDTRYLPPRTTPCSRAGPAPSRRRRGRPPRSSVSQPRATQEDVDTCAAFVRSFLRPFAKSCFLQTSPLPAALLPPRDVDRRARRGTHARAPR